MEEHVEFNEMMEKAFDKQPPKILKPLSASIMKKIRSHTISSNQKIIAKPVSKIIIRRLLPTIQSVESVVPAGNFKELSHTKDQGKNTATSSKIIKQTFETPECKRNSHQIMFCLAELKKLPVFSNISELLVSQMMLSATILSYEKNTDIYVEGIDKSVFNQKETCLNIGILLYLGKWIFLEIKNILAS
jgi:hypothetical protein